MKKIYFLVGMLVISHSYSQKVSWQREVKSSNQDLLSVLNVTLDGQYITGGSVIKNSSDIGQNNSGYDYRLIKIDQQGQKLWEKYYSGNQHDYLNHILPTQEGGFLLTGTSYSTLSLDKKHANKGSSDIWIIKTDENGEEQWQTVIGSRYKDEGVISVQSTDLTYFVAGNTINKEFGIGGKDVWIVKLDKKGNVSKEIMLGGLKSDVISKMIPTKDGGVLLGVNSRSSKTEISNESENSSANTNNVNDALTKLVSYRKTSDYYGEGDFWIVKLNKEGNVQWEKSYGGIEDDNLRSLSITDNGYLIGGESRSSASGNKKTNNKDGTDLWLISIDENGEELWQKTYSFGNRDILMSLNRIQNKDRNTKGFLIGGYTQSENRIKKEDQTFWMLYVDNVGKEIWRKYVEGKDKKKREPLVSAVLDNQGAYILAGTTANEIGEENWKIIKLKDKELDDLLENRMIDIYPNPVTDYCYVSIGVEFTEANIFIYDMSGKIIYETKTMNKVTKLPTNLLPQGVYIVKAQTNNVKNQILTSKIIKE